MARPKISPTGNECFFRDDEIIVSKTDTKGIITYANDVFCRIAGYEESELLGQNHNIIRDPSMPRCVFQLLWDVIGSGEEIFAYVKNMAKSGDHYWVFAHVTPSFGTGGQIVGYHSNRRVPPRSAIDAITPIYQALLAEEAKHSSVKQGIAAATALLHKTLEDAALSYGEFVFALSGETLVTSS